MLLQFNIFGVHERENNPSSQIHLDENRARFGEKCRIVFNWLMGGTRLTVLEAANHGVSSLPRRIKDITDKGFKVSKDYDGKIITYYMSKEDKNFNNNKIKNI